MAGSLTPYLATSEKAHIPSFQILHIKKYLLMIYLLDKDNAVIQSVHFELCLKTFLSDWEQITEVYDP